MLGVIAAVISGFKALISAFAYRFFQKTGSYSSLLLSIIISILAFWGLSQMTGLIGLIFILLLFLGAAYKDQIILILLQNEASGEERSTIISTYSFLTFILVGISMPLGGWTIDNFDMMNTLIVLAIITFIFGLIGLVLYKSNIKTTFS